MSTNNTRYEWIKLCPNCYNKLETRYDYFKEEYTCKSCGLVLEGHPHYGVVYPAPIVRKIKKN